MKNIKLLSFVLVLVLMSLSCKSFTSVLSNDTSNTPNNSANLPVIDFVTPAEPLNVTVQLDEQFTVSGPISVNGGSMVLKGADGTVFTLDVPAKALETDTVITMTAVKSITGAPLSNAAVAAVQLEPSGLFFNEFVTLTVTPAQEIPIENQIIFAYEGVGRDYHLAIIDPKSRAIKIKLLEFSGAGVGSGGDKEWAANLQNQANDSRARLQNEVAKLLQPERLAQLLGQEANDQISSILKSYMEQYYDQVIQKEMVAAELDCKYAEKAIQGLIGLERNNQLLGLNGEANGEIIPIVDDIPGKIAKLVKIGEKCKKSYSISGGAGDFSGTGTICDIEQPWTVTGSGVTVTFTPSSANGGTYSYSGSMSGFAVSGTGQYAVTYADGLAVSIQAGGEGSAGEATGSGDENYTLTFLSEGSCP
ncbi:MAG: hypothetical protein E4G99_10775 [Anaerolineales bacterium]|nr:MAG: hypothetical protein E4G99_10775 [Anaerolineales bacterium]